MKIYLIAVRWLSAYFYHQQQVFVSGHQDSKIFEMQISIHGFGDENKKLRSGQRSRQEYTYTFNLLGGKLTSGCRMTFALAASN